MSCLRLVRSCERTLSKDGRIPRDVRVNARRSFHISKLERIAALKDSNENIGGMAAWAHERLGFPTDYK